MRLFGRWLIGLLFLSAFNANAAPVCDRNHSYDRAMAVAAESLTKCQLSVARRAYGLMAPRYPDNTADMAVMFATSRCGDEYLVFKAVVAGCFSNGASEADRLVDAFHQSLMKQVERIVRESAPAGK